MDELPASTGAARPQPEDTLTELLRAWEHRVRATTLVALSEWTRIGRPEPRVMAALEGLARPSWGHWNGLLEALATTWRRMRAEAGPADGLRMDAAAPVLAGVARWGDQTLEATSAQGLQGLAAGCGVPAQKARKQKALLAWMVQLRNRVVHERPASGNEGEWLRLLDFGQAVAEALARGSPLAEVPAWEPGQDPWRILDQEEVWEFGGLPGAHARYARQDGTSREFPLRTGETLSALRRLLGSETLSDADVLRRVRSGIPEDDQGALLGNYLIQSPLGDGASCVVHRAVHLPTRQVVAVKVLRADPGVDDEGRLRREAEAMASIVDPRIARVLEYDRLPCRRRLTSGGDLPPWLVRFSPGTIHAFLALSLMHGQPLDGRPAAREEDGSLAETLEWFRQCAEAMASVHAAGVVHRDLSPRNILAPPRGEQGLPAIIDFGSARMQDPGRSRLTRPGQTLGTDAYCAPEVLAMPAGTSLPDEAWRRADIYSLGAVFFERLVGRRLPSGMDVASGTGRVASLTPASAALSRRERR